MPILKQPMTIHTTLNYYIPPSDGGVSEFFPGTAGNYRRKHDVRPVQIEDIRNGSTDYTVDRQGFELVKYPSAGSLCSDESRIKEVVYPEVAELLKQTTGATTVHPYSHIIRRQNLQDAIDEGRGLEDAVPVKTMTGAHFIHIDHSYDGAHQVIRDNLTHADIERLTSSRWGIINVWRPINQVVQRDALAVCDARTVREEDLHPVTARLPAGGSGTYENVSRGAGFETWHLTANPQHRWYYASQMNPGEALLIKIFDTKLDGTARRVPHSAFTADHDSGPARHSMEVRCLVFWEKESRD